MATILAILLLAPLAALGAPFAAIVIDARTGEVLHARNHDTRLHPASLTKMMTLYIAFEAVRNGEIGLDTPVRISANAAGQPCSCLGLRAGQTIAMRHLMRAAAVRSANDAATAIGEAISGSEAAFIARMNRTAQALGMTNTSFRNAHGLTAPGHLSSARDMTTLGRQLFFDFPEYWNLWSRRSADAGIATVSNTNRAFLDGYSGADGIKTGFTRAAGFNLTASAQRGERHIIVTVFGGQSVPDRTRRVTELMDLGFERAPRRAAVRRPPPPNYGATPPGGALMAAATPERPAAGRTIRIDTAVRRSPIPLARPVVAEPDPVALAALREGIETAIAEVAQAAPGAIAAADAPSTPPAPRPEALAATLPFATTETAAVPEPLEGEAVADAPADAGGISAEDRPFAMVDAAPAADAAVPTAEAGTEVPETEAPPFAIADAPAPQPSPDVTEAGPAPASEAVVALTQAAPDDAASAAAGEPISIALAAMAPQAMPVPQAGVPGTDTAEPAPQATIDPASLVVLTFAPAEDEEAGAGLASLARLGRVEPNTPPVEQTVAEAPETVSLSLSTSSPRLWAATLGRFPSRDAAERALIRSALADLGHLDTAPRRVERSSGGFEASFVGLTETGAMAACERLRARGQDCEPIGP